MAPQLGLVGSVVRANLLSKSWEKGRFLNENVSQTLLVAFIAGPPLVLPLRRATAVTRDLFSQHYDRGILDTNSARLCANISEKSLLSQELRGDLLRNGRRLSFPNGMCSASTSFFDLFQGLFQYQDRQSPTPGSRLLRLRLSIPKQISTQEHAART